MDYQDLFVPWEGWHVVDRIGRGGFGSVYAIERFQCGIREQAAMKVISIPQIPDEINNMINAGYDPYSITQRYDTVTNMIMDEYKWMAEMRGNSNIVYCDNYEIVKQSNGFGRDIYIKMELLTPLHKAKDRVDTDAAVIRFGIEMCNALEACQKKNIIHRDIKPENIFVSCDGTFKLGDFGIARKIEKTTRGTVGKGTYQFMAPEVKHGQEYGATVDIYSLGLVMHWLLNCQRCPFLTISASAPTFGEEQEALEKRFSGEKIPTPVNGSEMLKGIVLKACAFNPEDRYQSAREMRKDLMGALDDIQERWIVVPNIVSNIEPNNQNEEGRTVGPFFAPTQPEEPYVSGGTVGPIFPYKEEWDIEEPSDIPAMKLKWKVVIIVALLAVLCILVLCCVISNSYIKCKIFGHKWDLMTCTSPKRCAVCEATEGTALGHKWSAATCTQPKQCEVCEATDGVALGHKWSAATYDTPKTCSECGATEGRVKPKPLSEFKLSAAVGKVWIRGTEPYFEGNYHTKADAPDCWKDWSKPGYTGGTIKDNKGNTYSYGIHIDGWDACDYYYEIRLDGKYKTFSGVCACPEKNATIFGHVYDSNQKYTKYFEVYGDGELLFTSTTMRYDYKPQSFKIDVTGVNVLKILYPANGGPNETATIYDGMLS